jgi:hypothetical protein
MSDLRGPTDTESRSGDYRREGRKKGHKRPVMGSLAECLHSSAKRPHFGTAYACRLTV